MTISLNILRQACFLYRLLSTERNERYSARTLVTRGWRISFVSRCLRVSRAQLHAIARRPDDWQDRRCKRQPDDTGVVSENGK